MSNRKRKLKGTSKHDREKDKNETMLHGKQPSIGFKKKLVYRAVSLPTKSPIFCSRDKCNSDTLAHHYTFRRQSLRGYTFFSMSMILEASKVLLFGLSLLSSSLSYLDVVY